MRTTLDIDDDVLQAAKERAKREHKTAGEVVSALLRQALTAPTSSAPTVLREVPAVYGVRPFPSRGVIVTNDLIEQLRSDDAY
jgi:hypothetical protein